MAIIKLSSSLDPRLQAYTNMTERQLRSNLETSEGIFVAESEKVVRVALNSGLTPLSMLIEEHHIQTRQDLIELMLSQGNGAEISEEAGHLRIKPLDEFPIYVLERSELSKLVGYSVTRGIHALFKRPEILKPDELLQSLSEARRLAIFDGLTDSTNVGAAFRSAAALGVDAVLLSPTCCDPLVRRALRVSMGTIFQVPWATFPEWPEGLEILKERGFTVAALALKDDSYSLGQDELKDYEKLAMVFGTEGDGLSKTTIDACDITVRIPMKHGVDSLNVAAASAVAFWELCR